MPMERASQEEQNDANFSSVAPFSEELLDKTRSKRVCSGYIYTVHVVGSPWRQDDDRRVWCVDHSDGNAAGFKVWLRRLV